MTLLLYFMCIQILFWCCLLVLAVCVRHEESWPFVESVEEQMAPDYYHVIKVRIVDLFARHC